jgi:hypothetical protein
MLIRTCLVALGVVGAIAIATPAPTLAQGVHIEGPGGVGVHIGRQGHRERHYRGDRSDRSYAYDRRHYRGDRTDRSYAYERGRFGGCRTVTIEHDDGDVRRVRRCD